MKYLIAAAITFAALCAPSLGDAQDTGPDFDRLRSENVLAVTMTDEQISFYLDETKWPLAIPAEKRAEYRQENLNLRIVHVNAYLGVSGTGPGRGVPMAYRLPFLVPVENRAAMNRPSLGSMYNPLYVNMVTPNHPGGFWGTGVTLNHMRF